MIKGPGWSKRFVEHGVDSTTRLSIAFTWDLPDAYQRAVWLRQTGQRVIAGGPAVSLMPHYLAEVTEIGTDWPMALEQHNPFATFTSRGCIRRCPFCAVWRTEGELRELDDWPILPIVCDNNLLACSRRHFDGVIDKLKPVHGVDFNQGLDARLLTKHHASRLAELDCKVRLAFDHISGESALVDAWAKLRAEGIGKARIGVYVLFGYGDTPEDALYRLETVKELGIRPNPMRYNPLDALVRNSYVGPSWTAWQLRRFHRYWSRLRWLEHIPFEEYEPC